MRVSSENLEDSSIVEMGTNVGNVVSEKVQGDTKGVLRRPTVVRRAEVRVNLGRDRGTNMALENKVVSAQNNKVVGAQNETRGILVSNCSGVKESEIINIKPKIKRVTSSTNQGAVNKFISGKESECVESVGLAEKVQNTVMSETPVGNVALATSEQVQNGSMNDPSMGNASLIKLEYRISTLEMEVSNILSLIY